MKLRQKRKPFFIPLFSMSDIAFLLLIFIMLVSLINYRKEVIIEYPKTLYLAENVNEEKNLDIWIDIYGNIYLDGYIANDREDLEQKLLELSAYNTMVHIIADRNISYNDVNNVLDVLKDHHYRFVNFVVKTDD